MSNRKQGCKFQAIAYKHYLDDLDEELKEKYLEEDATLRELEHYVNRKIIRSQLDHLGIDYVPGEPDNYRRLLTDSDVRHKDRQEAETRLSEYGVNVDQLKNDLVSHQTVRTHLRDCLGVEKEKKEPLNPEKAKGTIDRLMSRLSAVSSRSVDRLKELGEVYVGEYDVYVSVDVLCNDCNRTYSVSKLIMQGGCECEPPADFPESDT